MVPAAVLDLNDVMPHAILLIDASETLPDTSWGTTAPIDSGRLDDHSRELTKESQSEGRRSFSVLWSLLH